MTVTEQLFVPLAAHDPGKPLITHYDDSAGTRVELSRATVANWAAKTANWLRDEHDIEPGDSIAVLLPAHWQTVGILLGAWWCGATVTTEPAGAKIAFAPPEVTVDAAEVVAVVSLHPMGLGTGAPVDYLDDVRGYGDTFSPFNTTAPDTVALRAGASQTWTVAQLVSMARTRADELNITPTSRVLSALGWLGEPDNLLSGFLAVLAGGGSLVQTDVADEATMLKRSQSEQVTTTLGITSAT